MEFPSHNSFGSKCKVQGSLFSSGDSHALCQDDVQEGLSVIAIARAHNKPCEVFLCGLQFEGSQCGVCKFRLPGAFVLKVASVFRDSSGYRTISDDEAWLEALRLDH